MKKIISLGVFALIIPLNVFAQCSDAGICTLGKHYFKEGLPHTSSISLGYIYGYSGKDPDVNGALNDISYGSIMLEADLDILKDTRLNISMPYSFSSGPLGSVHGAGDLIFAVTKSLKLKKDHTLSFSAGGRLATGKVNSDDSLPQRYMPGLGTNDLLLGASYSLSNYYFGLGYQKAFGRSANYVTRLKRGDDILIRAGFFEQFNKMGIKAEILTILKIQPNSVLNNVGGGESFIDVDGSNEPQVNLIAAVTYQASREFGLKGMAAIPLMQRDYNYDGLKRTISIIGTVSYFFKLK